MRIVTMTCWLNKSQAKNHSGGTVWMWNNVQNQGSGLIIQSGPFGFQLFTFNPHNGSYLLWKSLYVPFKILEHLHHIHHPHPLPHPHDKDCDMEAIWRRRATGCCLHILPTQALSYLGEHSHHHLHHRSHHHHHQRRHHRYYNRNHNLFIIIVIQALCHQYLNIHGSTSTDFFLLSNPFHILRFWTALS